jgi:large subunit ribosomal protein LP0
MLWVGVDNGASSQLQQTRIATRGRAAFLMGKNTVLRKVLREYCDAGNGNEALEELITTMVGNVGLCFINSGVDLKDLRTEIQANQLPAAAKTGAFAPIDVHIPAGPTPLDPGQTAFFQAMNIATKITKGAIEITSPVHIIEKGNRVTSSAVALLSKLGIKPFFFGIKVEYVYDNGSFYSATILDMTEDIMTQNFFAGVNQVAALSLALQYPTEASLPHSFAYAFKMLLALTCSTGITFAQAEEFKAVAAAGPAPAAAGDAPAAAAAPVVEDDEEEAAPAVDLFAGDGDAAY